MEVPLCPENFSDFGFLPEFSQDLDPKLTPLLIFQNKKYSTMEELDHILKDIITSTSESETVKSYVDRQCLEMIGRFSQKTIIENTQELSRALHDAIVLGHTSIIESFIANRSLDFHDSQGRTLFHCLAQLGYLPALEFLLTKPDIPINKPDFHGNTPLHLAVKSNFPDIVESLLKADTDPNALNNQSFSPLHLAILEKNITSMRLLLEYGADPNLITPYGFSPIQICYLQNLYQGALIIIHCQKLYTHVIEQCRFSNIPFEDFPPPFDYFCHVLIRRAMEPKHHPKISSLFKILYRELAANYQYNKQNFTIDYDFIDKNMVSDLVDTLEQKTYLSSDEISRLGHSPTSAFASNKQLLFSSNGKSSVKQGKKRRVA